MTNAHDYEQMAKVLDRNGLMSFSLALSHLKAGKKVAREGWNGKGMFVFLVNGSRFIVNRPPLLGIYPEGTEIEYHAHIDMKTAQGYVVPWRASQVDLLSEDWTLAECERPACYGPRGTLSIGKLQFVA